MTIAVVRLLRKSEGGKPRLLSTHEKVADADDVFDGACLALFHSTLQPSEAFAAWREGAKLTPLYIARAGKLSLVESDLSTEEVGADHARAWS